MGFPGGPPVKNLLPRLEAQDTQVRSLGWENPLEKEMATHSSILAWQVPQTEEPGRLCDHGITESQARLSEPAHTHTHQGVLSLGISDQGSQRRGCSGSFCRIKPSRVPPSKASYFCLCVRAGAGHPLHHSLSLPPPLPPSFHLQHPHCRCSREHRPDRMLVELCTIASRFLSRRGGGSRHLPSHVKTNTEVSPYMKSSSLYYKTKHRPHLAALFK